MPRIACVRLPGFVLQVHLRGSPVSADVPVAVSAADARPRSAGDARPRGAAGARPGATRQRAPVPRVIAVSRAAAAAGIQPGMTAPQAQAALNTLVVIPCDEALVRGAVTTIAEALLGLSPTVEPHPGWFFFAVSERSERSERNERSERPPGATRPRPVDGAGTASARRDARLAHAAHGLAATLRFSARVAVADERFTAAAVAQASATPVVVVAPGDSAATLAPLPAGLLPLTRDLARGLQLLGLHTLGDFARLTEAQVAARWGRPGALLHRLARGVDPTPLVAFAPPERLAEELRLEPPVMTLGELDLGLERIAEAVALRLRGRGAGAARVTLAVALDHAPARTITLRPTRPIAAARPLLDLVRASLGESCFDAPVAGLTVVVDEAVPLRPVTLDLFEHHRERTTHDLDVCLARLRAFLGEPAVHGVRLTDTHRPEAMYERVPFALPPALPAARPGSAPVAAPPPSSALRLLDPPVPVELDEGPTPTLQAFGRRGRITSARGPLRVSGEWWRAGFARDYFEVILDDGAHYWLFRDEEGRFFAQGVVD